MSQRNELKGSQVIHVRGDSDSDLEALFKAVMNPAEGQQVPQQLPFRLRNLPASFFNPPDPQKQKQQQQQQHSREGSTDSTAGYSAGAAPAVNPSNLTIAHPRAHSSPASLTQTLSAAPPPPPPTAQHVRQHSYDLTDEQPLPPGWEMAKTTQGQRYYLKGCDSGRPDERCLMKHHVDQTTSWHDPRKSLSTTVLNNQTGSPQSQQSPPVSLQNLGPLPPGWEQASTNEGEVYYINHVERTTSWYDPRIPMHMQRPSMRMQSPGQTQQQSLKQQQQQQAVVGSQANQSQRQVMSPTHMQQLRNLQMEKEQLKKRQDEIARQVQEMLLRAQIPENDIPMMQANEMTSVTDPFLGHSGQGDPHSRQESGDSGLGGMGTSYSLPRTPEDFLSNVDEMDTQDGGPKIQSQSDFSNMDIGNVGGSGENTNMDSDDLVPSLQEDISCELLKDVENVLSSNKVEGLLTWL